MGTRILPEIQQKVVQYAPRPDLFMHGGSFYIALFCFLFKMRYACVYHCQKASWEIAEFKFCGVWMPRREDILGTMLMLTFFWHRHRRTCYLTTTACERCHCNHIILQIWLRAPQPWPLLLATTVATNPNIFFISDRHPCHLHCQIGLYHHPRRAVPRSLHLVAVWTASTTCLIAHRYPSMIGSLNLNPSIEQERSEGRGGEQGWAYLASEEGAVAERRGGQAKLRHPLAQWCSTVTPVNAFFVSCVRVKIITIFN